LTADATTIFTTCREATQGDLADHEREQSLSPLREEPMLSLRRFHWDAAFFVIVRDMADPSAYGMAGAKNVRLLPDAALRRNPQPHQVAF
jgi:hypothetical protein